ncbi:gamma-butyrobetaine hydroxylase-like domain-containing protein [Aestuariivirga sp.]|uniref:gamma-butyrobetaine hydroxylase-like domain-containing protein n=1 Tax=Aestuariivirga sp. TaxID=2650926 RepID=UPI0039E5F2A2
MSDPWPSELHLARDRRSLTVVFEGNPDPVSLSAEYLRVESPSAEVKGHGPGQEQLVWGKRNITIQRLEPVGNYALRIIFDDGHSTGLYTWAYLAMLGQRHDEIWNTYLAKLKAEDRGRG